MLLKRKFYLGILLLLLSFNSLLLASATLSETEPNDTPAQANSLNSRTTIRGSINPATDVDFYKVRGINDLWGVVAFLDTENSTSSKTGVLALYDSDGSTLLQQDVSKSGKNGVIAWEQFTGRDEHFLRVTEAGQNQRISDYNLSYFALDIGRRGQEHAEQEPNNSLAAANTAARVNRGVVASATDKDCYAVYARAGETFHFVLNSDPEHDGGADLALDLYKKNGALWMQANRAGSSGNEYLRDVKIPVEGVYTYCVRGVSGAGPAASYLVGTIVNERGYEPHFQHTIQWDNPRPGNFARVGEEMRYTAKFNYTEPLTIPDELRLHVYYHPECMDVVDAGSPDYQYSTAFGWRYDSLSPNTSITKHFTMRAKAPCANSISFDVVMDYYSTGWGRTARYTIGQGYYLPLVLTKD